MRVLRLSLKILGAVAVLLVLAAAGGCLWLRSSGLPRRSGEVTLAGLEGTVEVRWDRWAVPHVRAGGEADLARALGYLHANDRFTQMELGRRTSAGRLAEVLGRSALPLDRYFRRFRFRQTAELLWASSGPDSRLWLEGYARGVNAWLEERGSDLPPGLRLLGVTPEPWRPTDCLLFALLMAENLSFVHGEVEEHRFFLLRQMGEERARDLIGKADLHIPAEILALAATSAGAVPEILGDSGVVEPAVGGGSNNWTLGTSRSEGGGPLVANDPHLIPQMPPTWYEAHLRAPGFEVRGMTLPGTPVVVIGQNRSLAWALTNTMLDDYDLFIEELDESGNRVKRGDGWLALTEESEEIRLRGGAAETLVVRTSDIGPVREARPDRGLPVRSLAWTIYEPGDPFEAFLKLARAASLDEVVSGIGRYVAPAQNLVVAHRDGGLLYTVLGRIPRRRLGDGRLPSPGWNPEYGWDGLRPLSQNPMLRDPAEDVLVTANNDVLGPEAGFPFTANFELSHRHDRIRQRILEREARWRTADVAESQLDRVSLHAREVVAQLAGAYEEDAALAWKALSAWSGEMAPEGVSALFALARHHLDVGIFDDERKAFGLRRLSAIATDESLLRVLRGDMDAVWFDDLTTSAVETRGQVLAAALGAAWAEGRERWGNDVGRWRYDDLHQLTLGHPLGRLPLLGKWWNRGPFPLAGSATTIAAAGGHLMRGKSIPVTFISSMRSVMDTAHGDRSLAVLPGGQSGHPADPHYDDQIALFLGGDMRPLAWSEDAIGRATISRLTLRPMNGKPKTTPMKSSASTEANAPTSPGTGTADGAEIAKIHRQAEVFSDAFSRGDADTVVGLIADVYTDHNWAQPRFSREAFRARLNEIFAQYETTIKVELHEVVVYGEYAFARGEFFQTLRPRDGGETTEVRKRFMEILHQEADASWKYFWGMDAPAPEP